MVSLLDRVSRFAAIIPIVLANKGLLDSSALARVGRMMLMIYFSLFW